MLDKGNIAKNIKSEKGFVKYHQIMEVLKVIFKLSNFRMVLHAKENIPSRILDNVPPFSGDRFYR